MNNADVEDGKREDARKCLGRLDLLREKGEHQECQEKSKKKQRYEEEQSLVYLRHWDWHENPTKVEQGQYLN